MDGDTIQALQCTKHIHEAHELALKPYIGQFAIVYFDDILVYRKTNQDYMTYLRVVLGTFGQTNYT